jgi:selenocysteine lyase/cysteine desulfurase
MTGADDRRSAVQAAMTLLFEYEKSLTTHLIEGLVGIEGVTVQGITSADAMDRRVPTVAFTHDRIAPATVAQALAQENIFVWNGFNYAVEVAKSLGIYETGGAVRVGPVHYNSHDEIDELLIELGRIVAS